MRSLEDNRFARHVYSKSLAACLKKIVRGHIDSICQFPDSRFAQALPALISLSCPTMFQFDCSSPCTLQVPPYDDAWAYYAYSSSHDKLGAIRMPFLALNSHDDPIARCAPQDYDRNEWFTLVVTHGGGHLGWFQPGGAPNHWAGRPVLEWFRATGEDIPSWLSRDWRRLWRLDKGAICGEVYRWMVTGVECASLWSLLNHCSRLLIPKSQSFRCGL